MEGESAAGLGLGNYLRHDRAKLYSPVLVMRLLQYNYRENTDGISKMGKFRIVQLSPT